MINTRPLHRALVLPPASATRSASTRYMNTSPHDHACQMSPSELTVMPCEATRRCAVRQQRLLQLRCRQRPQSRQSRPRTAALASGTLPSPPGGGAAVMHTAAAARPAIEAAPQNLDKRMLLSPKVPSVQPPRLQVGLLRGPADHGPETRRS